MSAVLEGFVKTPASDVAEAFLRGATVEVVQPYDGGLPPPPRFVVALRDLNGDVEVRLTDGWFFYVNPGTPDVWARIDGSDA